MPWAEIWQAIHSLLTGLTDAGKWKMSIDGTPNEPITGVTISEAGIRFAFTVGSDSYTLEAVPGSSDHAIVKVNGVTDTAAHLVFTLKHQLLKPIIVVFEFDGVSVTDGTHNYRFDNPK